MYRKAEPSVQRIDLGAASRATKGGPGIMVDLVRYIEPWGISTN